MKIFSEGNYSNSVSSLNTMIISFLCYIAQDNLHAKYGQLDVALALRDQRVLNEAMKAPRSTRRALRNPLTQRFPAVPLTSKFRYTIFFVKPGIFQVSLLCLKVHKFKN